MSRPITSAALSQIEAGRFNPTQRTIDDLATALEVPTGFFYARWPDTTLAQYTEPPTYFRRLAATPARDRNHAGVLALILSDLIAAIEERVRLPEFRLPDYEFELDAPGAEIETAAEALRDQWELGSGPIANVTREVEKRGVPVARLSFDTAEAVDAFSVLYARRPVMLIRDGNYVRERFDVCHELAHLIGHRSVIGPRDKRVEDQAHRFAGAFLMPREAACALLPRRFNNDGWWQLAQLKSQWGISMGALLQRGKNLGIVSPEAFVSARKFMAVRGWHNHEPGDREMGRPEAALLLERALGTLRDEFALSPEAVAEAAHLPVRDALAVIAAANDQRPSINL